MAVHQFSLQATWSGGLYGTGNLEAGNLRTAISVPAELKGPGVGTNPEEMLLGAAAACYLITLAKILEQRQLPVLALNLESEAYVRLEGQLVFERIIHRPKLAVKQEISEELREKILHAALLAEKSCMISRALQGNVVVEAEPQIIADAAL